MQNIKNTPTRHWAVRVTDDGRRALRLIAADTGETIGAVLQRIALAELARVEAGRASAPRPAAARA